MFAVFLLYSAVFPIVQMCLELSRGSLTWSLASILSGMYELLHAHTPHALSSTLKALDRADSKDPPPPSFSTEHARARAPAAYARTECKHTRAGTTVPCRRVATSCVAWGESMPACIATCYCCSFWRRYLDGCLRSKTCNRNFRGWHACQTPC